MLHIFIFVKLVSANGKGNSAELLICSLLMSGSSQQAHMHHPLKGCQVVVSVRAAASAAAGGSVPGNVVTSLQQTVDSSMKTTNLYSRSEHNSNLSRIMLKSACNIHHQRRSMSLCAAC
jgi:hypothetical protein